MRKITLFILLFLVAGVTLAQRLSVLVDYKSYCTPAHEPYLEVSSFVNGKTVLYVPNGEGKFQAEVRITLLAFQEELLVNELDFILVSEPFEDSIAATKPNFGGIENIKLPNGEYVIQVSVQDINSTSKPTTFADIIVIDHPQDNVTISDISLYRSIERELKGDIFDKYGFSFVPLFYGFVPETVYSLLFSCEIYNTDKIVGSNEPIFVKSFISCFENNLIPYPEARFNSNFKAQNVVVSIGEIGIYKLHSGNYNLTIEVYSKDSLLLATNSYFFQRSNPSLVLNLEDINAINIVNTFADNIKDSVLLLDYVRSLYPISTPIEKEFYNTKMNRISSESLKRFFYAFWLKRDPVNPEKAWKEYLAKVNHVNREFGCKLVKGYRTDRGRIYLKYGPPNSIFESPYDSHSYPYEIWHYYHCVDQMNVKFVFYNIDLVTKDFQLLHSNKRGEHQDPFWKIKLTQRKTPHFNFDITTPEDYFGGNPKDDWFIHR